jgi:hypothetical protein
MITDSYCIVGLRIRWIYLRVLMARYVRDNKAIFPDCLNPLRIKFLPINMSSVRTSQETYNVSAIKPSWLMLFREKIHVYCGNNTQHTDTLCGQNVGF